MRSREGKVAVEQHTSIPFFVITRAGISLDGRPVSEEWLHGRARLFRTYFAPALNGQTDQDFTLLACFDARVEQEIVDHFMSGVTCAYEVLRTGDPWMQAVSAYFSGSDEIITATCDSDDALAHNFVATVRELIRPEHGLNFQQVIRYSPDSGQFMMKPKPCNPFVSRRARSGRWVLEHTGDHGGLWGHVPIDDVWSPPMGLQVVHGANAYNQMWNEIPPVPARFAMNRFTIDFPRYRKRSQFTVDYLRYLADPRRVPLFIRRKGVRAVIRTFFRR